MALSHKQKGNNIMKKIAIVMATAFALATTASLAQPTVTVSGKVNIGAQKTGDGKTALVGGADGNDSRLIFKGAEDLGSGLKVNFILEAGFKPDTGTFDNTANQVFQRQSWIGLSSGFGEVRAGRQYTLGFLGSIANMPSTYTDPQLAAGLGFNGAASRNNDQIQYWSPTVGGIQLGASTQLSGDTDNKTNEVAVKYTSGPIAVNLTSTKLNGTDGQAVGLNASYDFTVAKVAIGAVDKAGAGTGKGSFVRVIAPIGQTQVFAGYAHNSDSKVDAYDVGAYYSLSTRTRLYAIYAAGNKTVTDRTTFGIDHNF
jgi:general bacterial porin, GBP family